MLVASCIAVLTAATGLLHVSGLCAFFDLFWFFLCVMDVGFELVGCQLVGFGELVLMLLDLAS